MANENKDIPMTNIPMMDQQHKEIIALAHELSKAFQNLETIKALLPICNRLFSACRQHFDDEERLMLKYFYPYTESHIGLHMDYTNILATLINNIKSEAYGDAIDTMTFMIKWHIDHMNEADRHYADFIHTNSA